MQQLARLDKILRMYSYNIFIWIKFRMFLRNVVVSSSAITIITNFFCLIRRIYFSSWIETSFSKSNCAPNRLFIWCILIKITSVVLRYICVSARPIYTIDSYIWHYCLSISRQKISLTSSKFVITSYLVYGLSSSKFHYIFYYIYFNLFWQFIIIQTCITHIRSSLV